MPPRLLIVGQGLAGTAVAWQLWRRGIAFRLVDRDEPVTSSKIAAGLISPITGLRLSLHEHYDTWLREAVASYRSHERVLSQHFLHARGHVHLYRDEHGPRHWAKRLNDPAAQPFIHRGPFRMNGEVFHTERGGFQTKHAGWLDTAGYLAASRAFFAANGVFQTGEVLHTDLTEHADRIDWRGHAFTHVVYANGWHAAQHPWFNWVPFEPARGTILTARAGLHGERRLINCGCWIVPRPDGTLRIGSTFETKFTDPHGVDDDALAGLHAKIGRLLKVPLHIESQASAVRPVIRLQRTLIGTHPAHPRIAFINGLGSKGTLRAPHFARRLVEHLIDGTPIPPSMDVQGNL